jgi:hypothetical protein
MLVYGAIVNSLLKQMHHLVAQDFIALKWIAG